MGELAISTVLLRDAAHRLQAYAIYGISSGRIEGINNKIKALRRQGYGYPDDEYFFLKLMDMSRNVYIHNAFSYKVCD